MIEPEKEISLEKSEPFEVPNESVDGAVEERKERRAERKTDAREETLVKEFLPESSCACSVEGEGSFALVWWVVIVLCGMRYGWRA